MEELDRIEEDPEREKKSPRFAFYAVLGIILVFASIFGLSQLSDLKFIDIVTPTGSTVVRASEESYTFNGYEFSLVDGNWYTDIFNHDTNTIYTVGFHYDPDKLRNINIVGRLSEKFLSSKVYYVTFDPTKEDLKYTALASAELQLSMARAMMLPLKAACTKEHAACAEVPIITCKNTDKPVFFIEENEKSAKIMFEDNCVTISGKGEELVKAVDRLLYFWYGVMV